MKIAHLILAHKNPKQLERFLNAMSHPGFDFYIHIDKKTNIEPFLYLANRKNVYLVKNRARIYWAAYGTIQATLNGFQEITPKGYDYINVISGQDFPLKSADYIYQYIHDRQGKEFITCESIENEWREAAPRVKHYHLINWQIPGRHRLEKLLNKILPERKFPLKYEIVGRANWVTLTNIAAKYILDFLDEHPEVIRYFKYCWGADEFIFATIMYNSKFNDEIRDNLVHVIWYEGKGHPEILISKNFEELKKSDKLFARKFDVDIDADIIDMLEKWIASEKSVPGGS
jgi:Core-2/I-Branching enzyme